MHLQRLQGYPAQERRGIVSFLEGGGNFIPGLGMNYFGVCTVGEGSSKKARLRTGISPKWGCPLLDSPY